MKAWFVAYTKPRNEKKVLEYLSKQGYEVYCPLVKTLRQWSDRKKMVSVPMFTSYIFARLSELERGEVIKHPGIQNFVHWQGRPAVLRQTEIDDIRKVEAHGSGVELVSRNYVKGQTIDINEGPFRGLSGEVRKVDNHKLSIWIEALKSSIVFSIKLKH